MVGKLYSLDKCYQLLTMSHVLIILSASWELLRTGKVTRGSSVGIASGYGLDDQRVGVRVPVGSSILTSYRPDRLWGPPNLLTNGYRGLFLRR
jgi:hypothetical protein